ncbi:DNA cytosine methyltransferase [Ruminococcus sp.]|uniref:DNA cytosine methyltransferase n=1 Tax=Ruminococcus sp. TaxID=41978 RepID=UPI001B4B0A96|nr:DNA cytosine methyltransferase [Ruminococcus sp.]MBP5432218.1 DNA cytosine methyltransferase [Ruminococcus sp.]
MKKLKVLVACEESQRVCTAFRELGHEAYSADILEPSGNHPEWHILGDVLEVLNPKDHLGDFEAPDRYISFRTMDGSYHEVGKWDIIIAHPPCTYLSNAGARHLWKGHKLNEERYKLGLEGKKFFMNFINAECEHICVENPIPSKIYEMPPYTQTIQPYEYGHPFSKRTCLWLKGLPELQPTNMVEPIGTYCPSGSYSHKHDDKHRGLFTKDRPRQRSKTFEGIAAAIAEQYSEYVLNE